MSGQEIPVSEEIGPPKCQGTVTERHVRRVALIYDARLPYDLKVMAGVGEYIQHNSRFSIYIEENALKDQRLPDLDAWEGDGIIADFDHPKVADAVMRSRLPTVGFGSGYGWYDRKSLIPYFFTNNQSISELAFKHLFERGLRQFAFCGFPATPVNGWSQEREQAFVAIASDHGVSCDIYVGYRSHARKWASLQASLGKWLGSLPKPIGVMAANDYRARQVLEACRAHDIRVPEEVAVVGVDNDELLCMLSTPLLTSIEQGAKRIGYDAAALLDALMGGKTPHQRSFIVDPIGVITRQSTDILATTDSKIIEAMALIREQACSGIKVREVAKALAISRSTLENRFRSALGYSVCTAIRRIQLERARQLTVATRVPLKQVADRTGFRSVQHMTTLFRKCFGKPPARYRKDYTM